MKYRLWIEDGEGHPITLNGYKEAKDDPGFDVWSDTTTLFTHILAGHVPPVAANEVGDDGEKIVATGILHVLPADFAVQMTTFRVDPAHRLDALGTFGRLFLGSMWETWKPGKDD
jgi:cholesterol oxidase